MSNSLPWTEIAIRLALTIVAGAAIGINRTERGRAVGLRTTILVCLAASVSMIQANLLLATHGKAADSYSVLDLMRLPLGILTGMGFIGAGAILRSGGSVQGVTTAATLWLVTVLGLCLGGGQLGLGAATVIIALLVLWALKHVERHISTVIADARSLRLPRGRAPAETLAAREIRALLLQAGYSINKWEVAYRLQGDERQLVLHSEVRWVGKPDDTRVPEILERFKSDHDILSIRWSG